MVSWVRFPLAALVPQALVPGTFSLALLVPWVLVPRLRERTLQPQDLGQSLDGVPGVLCK